MYSLVLALHSWNRWLVLLALLATLGRAYWGWLARRPYLPADRRLGALLIGLLHVQLMLGLTLYFALSPWTMRRTAAPGVTVHFWSVTHISLMLSAIVVAQLGQSLARRAATDAARHRWSALSFSLALGLILLGIPFASRPWFRW